MSSISSNIQSDVVVATGKKPFAEANPNTLQREARKVNAVYNHQGIGQSVSNLSGDNIPRSEEGSVSSSQQTGPRQKYPSDALNKVYALINSFIPHDIHHETGDDDLKASRFIDSDDEVPVQVVEKKVSAEVIEMVKKRDAELADYTNSLKSQKTADVFNKFTFSTSVFKRPVSVSAFSFGRAQ